MLLQRFQQKRVKHSKSTTYQVYLHPHPHLQLHDLGCQVAHRHRLRRLRHRLRHGLRHRFHGRRHRHRFGPRQHLHRPRRMWHHHGVLRQGRRHRRPCHARRVGSWLAQGGSNERQGQWPLVQNLKAFRREPNFDPSRVWRNQSIINWKIRKRVPGADQPNYSTRWWWNPAIQSAVQGEQSQLEGVAPPECRPAHQQCIPNLSHHRSHPSQLWISSHKKYPAWFFDCGCRNCSQLHLPHTSLAQSIWPGNHPWLWSQAGPGVPVVSKLCGDWWSFNSMMDRSQ